MPSISIERTLDMNMALVYGSRAHQFGTFVVRSCPSVLARSVTGVIHRFSSEFDEDAAILAMMGSSRWPRPGYLVGLRMLIRAPDMLRVPFD